MNSAAIAALFASGGEDKLYVEDVFSTYAYTGNGSTQTITNGIDLATKGGMVWIKDRDNVNSHSLWCTLNNEYYTSSNATSANTQDWGSNGAVDFNSDGFGVTSYNSGVLTNGSARGYVGWTTRNAPKFFTHTTAVKAAGVDKTVDLSTLGTVGMVAVKRTDSTGDWYVWHRSLTAGKLLYLNNSDAEATLGHITVSGTTLTLEDGVIADGTYIVYAWAHDASADGIIQCGAFTTDGSGNATVTLGWEPQLLELKSINATGNWTVVDSARGFTTLTGAYCATLRPNYSGAEDNAWGGILGLSATGFSLTGGYTSRTYIYLAIRRGPMRVPTDATKVYNAIARTGTGAAATVTGVGFAPDLGIVGRRTTTGTGCRIEDRLRGATQELNSGSDGAESAVAQSIISFDVDGIHLGTDGDWNANAADAFINWFFRRAPGFFDEVCDTGTGSAHAISHNLGVPPELMIRKKRSAADAWYVYYGDATDYLILNATDATADLDTIWNDTAPTSTQFTVGTHDDVNQSTGTFVTYLFASCPGVSKIGTFTGNGSTQNIDCGFAAGARFVLIKAISATGSWAVGDSTRGIVAGNDPYLLLNTTGAEVTDKDWLDSYAAGFTVNETTGPNANTNGVTYLFWAVS